MDTPPSAGTRREYCSDSAWRGIPKGAKGHDTKKMENHVDFGRHDCFKRLYGTSGTVAAAAIAAASPTSGQYVAKVDNAVIIQDASMTMGTMNQRNLQTSKNLLTSLNQSLPADLKVNLELRSFGHSDQQSTKLTESVYGMTPYSRAGLQKGIDSIKVAGGNSPLAAALLAAGDDLKGASGKSAIIVISDGLKDGLQMDTAPAAAAKVKANLGDNVCIYTVLVGGSPAGQALLNQVTQAGKCGSAETAEALTSSAGMKSFVEEVFLAPAPKMEPKMAPMPMDSDGDGVTDDIDKCPDTPKGAAVDKYGCPLDSDGDGVLDYLDKCPGTPKGAIVDAQGCELKLTLHINFDTNQAAIKPEFKPELEKAAAFIRAHANVPYVVISGYTDSQGSESYNQQLSERRAEAVRQELIKNYGVDESKIRSKGFGESNPIADNGTPEGRSQNRRVEVSCCSVLPQ